MKTININDIELQYEVIHESSEYGDSFRTDFYKGTETVTRKKWILFDESIQTERPKKSFYCL